MSLSKMSDSDCAELREIALAMPAEHVPATPSQLAKQLQFIAATLPSKNVDELNGQMRTAVYARILGGYSKDALAYLTERACRELNWFPTPHQCLTILEDYRPRATRKEKALLLCANHVEDRFQAFLALLQTGEASQPTIDAAPERWQRIAYERGLLKREGEGFALRPADMPC